MKIDRLFIAKDCPDCAEVRAVIDVEAVMDDDFRGKDGQELYVFSALSDSATRELLNVFGLDLIRRIPEQQAEEQSLLSDKFAPVLLTSDGEVLDKPGKIVVYLQDQGMVRSD